MSKFFALSAIAVAVAVAFGGQAYAAQQVARADASLTVGSVAKNGASFLVVEASDADGAPVSGLKPMASVSPSYAASVGNFFPCDGEAGRDACAAAGAAASAGTYVAKVTAKDAEGDARIGIYLPGKFMSVVLKVGAAPVPAMEKSVVPAANPASSEALPKASAAKAGGDVRGVALALALLALVAVPAALAARISFAGKGR